MAMMFHKLLMAANACRASICDFVPPARPMYCVPAVKYLLEGTNKMTDLKMTDKK